MTTATCLHQNLRNWRASLRSTNIANCVFHSFLSYTAIMLNIVTIHAISKTSSLPNTLKTFLLSLAVSDVGVGLLSQPFYTSLLVKWLQQHNPDCKEYMMFTIIISVFSMASFFGVAAISVDRFLAIHLHPRYQELVTHKRVVVVVISTWLLSVFFSSMISWTAYDIYYIVELLFGILSLVLTAIVNIKIYLTVQLHKNQIQALQGQQRKHRLTTWRISLTSWSLQSVYSTYTWRLWSVICLTLSVWPSLKRTDRMSLWRDFFFSQWLSFTLTHL